MKMVISEVSFTYLSDNKLKTQARWDNLMAQATGTPRGAKQIPNAQSLSASPNPFIPPLNIPPAAWKTSIVDTANRSKKVLLDIIFILFL